MSKTIQELLSGLPAWENALTEDGHIDENNRVTIKEAFASPDAAALFPKVISRTLREAAEPQLLVTPLQRFLRDKSTQNRHSPLQSRLKAKYRRRALSSPLQKKSSLTPSGIS
jgi:hypothetical protein